MNLLDWTVIRTAATGGLLVIIPGAFVSSVLLNNDATGLSWLFLCIVFVGFGVAGFVGGRLRPDTPMLHGALGGLLAFVVTQVFGLMTVLSRGGSVVWIAIPLTALLAISLGVGGALLSDIMHRRTVRTPNTADAGR